MSKRLMEMVERTIRVWGGLSSSPEMFFEVLSVGDSGRRGVFAGVENGKATLFLGEDRIRMDVEIVETLAERGEEKYYRVLMPKRTPPAPGPLDHLHS